jgi:hypothetical protein
MPQRRYAMSAHVSAESRRAWKRLTDDHGVNFAALIEVLPTAVLEQLSGRQWDRIVAAARAVEAERRRRAQLPNGDG